MDFEKLAKHRDMGFNKLIGLTKVEIREGYAHVELELQPIHMNPVGSTHGGLIYTIADIVGGGAASSRGKKVTTISGNINYLNPAMNCKKLIGESREIKVGKNICVYEVEICDETGKIIAIATMTYYYLGEWNFN